jgi:hypothetical protein
MNHDFCEGTPFIIVAWVTCYFIESNIVVKLLKMNSVNLLNYQSILMLQKAAVVSPLGHTEYKFNTSHFPSTTVF